MKKASEVGVDQISASNSNHKPGTRKQSDELPANPNPTPSTQQPNTKAYEHTDEPNYGDGLLWPFSSSTVWTECSVRAQIRSEQIGSFI